MKFRIFIFLLLAAFALVIGIGIKTPPTLLEASSLPEVNSITTNENITFSLSNEEIEFWHNLEFEKVENDSPGNTPDYYVKISSMENSFSAMYNKNSPFVFFSFIPEIEYGFLNSPPPGGWVKPLYKTKATDDLLSFLRIN